MSYSAKFFVVKILICRKFNSSVARIIEVKKEKEYYDTIFADLIVGSFVSSRIARYKLDNAGNPSGSILRDIESTDRIWPRIIGLVLSLEVLPFTIPICS